MLTSCAGCALSSFKRIRCQCHWFVEHIGCQCVKIIRPFGLSFFPRQIVRLAAEMFAMCGQIRPSISAPPQNVRPFARLGGGSGVVVMKSPDQIVSNLCLDLDSVAVGVAQMEQSPESAESGKRPAIDGFGRGPAPSSFAGKRMCFHKFLYLLPAIPHKPCHDALVFS